MRHGWTLSIAVFAILSAGVVRAEDPKSGPKSPSPVIADLLIGAYLSMTGSEAAFGISTHEGITLAVEEQNAKGGVRARKIVLHTLDTTGRSQGAEAAVTRLITHDHVTALIGEVASSLSLAGAAVAQKQRVPMITPASTNAKVTEVGDMISRACFIDRFQGEVMAKFARTTLKLSKVATLVDRTSTYSRELGTSFETAFAKLGGKIATTHQYASGDTDWKTQLEAIRDAKPDAIFVPGYYTDVGPIARQARALGIKVPLLGGDGWDSPQLAQLAGPAIDGGYFVNHFAADDPRPAVKELVKKYQARYNKVPDGLAALGYDAARILFDAMERAPTLSGKDLAAAIASTKNFAGATGTITIDATNATKKSAVIMQLKAGKPVHAATVAP